jgi:hypothetical protein
MIQASTVYRVFAERVIRWHRACIDGAVISCLGFLNFITSEKEIIN